MIASNNRFLMKTNPQLTRALADSGSSLNHPEIQRLARQQVDLGLWGNLKLWVHRDLVKTRTSGSDLFVPKAYDMSGNNNDAAQATEANQPKLVSTGMEFDGSNDSLDCGNDSSLKAGTGDFSFSVWFYADRNNKGHEIISDRALGAIYAQKGFIFGSFGNESVGVIGFILDDGIDAAKQYDNTNLYDISTWYHFAGTWKNSTDTMLLYKNASDITSYLTKTKDDSLTGKSIASTNGFIIANRVGTTVRCWDGILNDIRIFNTALTSTQISAIYDTTKSYYGL